MTVRVLIVDDEPNLCVNLSAYLEDEGMEVCFALSGEDAIVLLNGGTTVDVVVTDMRLPGMDGNDTIRAIHAAHPSVLFAIHTGTSVYAVPEDLRAFGITENSVFKKPMKDMAILADALEDLVAQKGDGVDG
ncbi:MAG: response regulator [Candidatus Hydrogenedentes bacterium]|nr:response regulator [Candidatus Hydrogenedentota bacterium]